MKMRKIQIITSLGVILALIAVFFGPLLQFANAATVTNHKDTLSRLKISIASNHEWQFVSPSGVDATTDTIIYEFDVAGTAFDFGAIALGDIDLLEDTDSTPGDCAGTLSQEVLVSADTAATNEWLVTINTTNDTITVGPAAANDTGAVTAANACVILRVGTNATGGVNQITNPATAGSYRMGISGAFGDTGETTVQILENDQVGVSATITQTLSFSISDVSIGFGTWTGTELRYATGDEAGSTTEPGAGLPTQLTATTNAGSGLSITITSQGNGTSAGLYKSVSPTKLISAVASSTVAAGSEGYGVYGKAATGLTIDEGFDNDAVSDLAVSTSAQTFASTTGPVSNGTVDVVPKAAIATTTPTGSYSDALTLVATANF